MEAIRQVVVGLNAFDPPYGLPMSLLSPLTIEGHFPILRTPAGMRGVDWRFLHAGAG
jgi:hypothetical protein